MDVLPLKKELRGRLFHSTLDADRAGDEQLGILFSPLRDMVVFSCVMSHLVMNRNALESCR